MSYILDALKKSSEERRKLQEEEQHSPLPLNTPGKLRPHRQYRLVKVLLPAIFVVLCLAGWWFFSYPELRIENAAQQEPVLPVEPTALEEYPELKTTEQNDPATDGSAGQVPNRQPATVRKQGPADLDKADTSPYPTARSGLPLLEELPLSFQSQLPEMKYSGHVFSPNPELRMIMINTTVVREGDLISPDLRLKEITSDGLTMSHKGTDFRVELF